MWLVRAEGCWASVLHPRRVSIMPQQRARCICANTSSREIDERSERELGRERRHGDGVRGVVRRDLRAAASMPLARKPRLFFVTGEGASAQFLAMADPHADRRR